LTVYLDMSLCNVMLRQLITSLVASPTPGTRDTAAHEPSEQRSTPETPKRATTTANGQPRSVCTSLKDLCEL
jgi:hypothetical protein